MNNFLRNEVPAEYLKGFTKFLNCKIDLQKRVFIPRIETEFWVKKTLKKLSGDEPRALLDIFAGSGCIGIAILKNFGNNRLDFVDIDERAIKQIKINLKLNRIPKERCKIYKSNLFERIRGRRYDIVFANPPYVAEERLNEVQQSVLKHEPKRAIWGGKRGLVYIRRFLREAKRFLNPNGIIYLEIDPQQKEEIKQILKRENYDRFRFFKDQFKRYRWVEIRR